LMYESHASYSACGLGSEGTDRLVALARDAGAAQGIYGAKITGGGSGGTVAILADANAGVTIRTIARRYTGETGRDAYVFEGSSPGAARVGAIRLDEI
jgi:galactokinase